MGEVGTAFGKQIGDGNDFDIRVFFKPETGAEPTVPVPGDAEADPSIRPWFPDLRGRPVGGCRLAASLAPAAGE